MTYERLTNTFCCHVQDELAATSHYEAALYDDPAIDAEEYFSDWEYYSDDYYDEDSTVQQSTLRAKSEPARGHPGTRAPNRVPKQKSPIKIDIATFQGVIWRTAALEKDQDVAVQIYQPGDGEKVALLENWREIFKSTQPSLNKSRLRERKARGLRELHSSEVDVFDADDEVQEDGRHDSSDEMSDILSTDQVESAGAENDSNTTPEPSQSPNGVNTAKRASSPAKRGRKRKADVTSPDPKKSNSNSAGNSMRSRSKRVALESGPEDSGRSGASSGPVRRSTRQSK